VYTGNQLIRRLNAVKNNDKMQKAKLKWQRDK
jgi:hypothetical protein